MKKNLTGVLVVLSLVIFTANIGVCQTYYDMNRYAVFNGLGATNDRCGITHWHCTWMEGTPSLLDSTNADGGTYCALGNSDVAFDHYGVSDVTPHIAFLFRGTGISMSYSTSSIGGVIHWNVDNGAATGSVDSLSATPYARTTIPIVSQGTLNIDEIHIIKVFTGPRAAPGRWACIDGFSVFDDSPLTRVESDSSGQGVDPGGFYDFTGSGIDSGGGFVKLQGDVLDATLSFTFTGISVAVNVMQKYDLHHGGTWRNTGTWDWSLDGGAQTGTVTPFIDAATTTSGEDPHKVRYPELIINGLAETQHTLLIANKDDQNSWITIDAFDIIESALAVEDWERY